MLPVCGAYIWRGLYMEGLIFRIYGTLLHSSSLINDTHVACRNGSVVLENGQVY